MILLIGKSVRGEDDEGVSGNCENRRNGIDSKNEVGGAKSNEHEEQRSASPATILTKEKLVSMKIGGDGNQFSGDSDQGVMVRLNLGFASFEKFDPSVNKKCAKNVDQPVKAVN